MTDAPDPSLRDSVTGLANRRALVGALRERVPAGQGALILLDLDGFRRACVALLREKIDLLLLQVTDRLKAVIGADGLFYRYGGDAFCLLIPQTDRDNAAAVAETLRAAIERKSFIVDGGPDKPATILSLTATAAVAVFPQDGRTPTLLIETAELALLASKHLGPNRVVVAGRLDPAVLAEVGVFRGLPCPVMVGRVAEQSRLRQAALDVRHVGPTFALVTGSAGIGKTRFVQELCRWARTERFVVMSGLCREARSTLPYAALAELIENLLVTDRALALASLDRLTPVHQAALSVVLRDLPPRETPANIELTGCGRLILEALGALLDELAKTGSLLFVLDDAEYSDAATFEALRAARDRRVPFFAIATTHQDLTDFQRTPAGNFIKERAVVSLHLPMLPLSVEEVEKLLHAILPDADIAHEIVERLVKQAGGNPFYLEETIRSLLLRGRARLIDGKWSIPVLEAQDLPRDLDDAIRSVSEALPVRANELLIRAAVIGNQIEPDLLQEVLGQDEMEMLDLIDEVRRSRLLVASETGSDVLLFPAAHARRIRLAGAPEAERREIHGRVGVVQEARHGGEVAHLADELAFHYSRAGNEERARHFDAVARKRSTLIQPPQAEGIRRARLDPVKEPLSPNALNHAMAMMRHFHGALKIGRLYPQWSKVSATFVAQLREEMEALLATAPGITIANSASGPQINGVPCALPAAVEFIALLDERLIESITILPPFDLPALESVVRAFMEPVNRGGAEPDLWNRFLTREGLQTIDIAQRAFQARNLDRARVETRQEEPVPAEELSAVRDTLRALKAAVDGLKLYPPGHKLVEESAGEVIREMLNLLQRVPFLMLGTSEGELVLNGRPVDRKFFGDPGAFILLEIDRRELKSLALLKGLTEDEVRALISFLSMVPEEQAPAAQRLQNQFVHVTFGSYQYERAREGSPTMELAPPPKPIRSEIRARGLLARPYEDFLSRDLQQQFPALVEVLAYGTRRPLAEELVARLGSHFHDSELLHRRIAYKLLGQSLMFASPSARRVEVAHSASALRRRLVEDVEGGSFRAASDLLHVWIPAAATVGCLRELAEIAGPILRRRANSPETPPEVVLACNKVLQVMPDTGAYAILLAAAEKPRSEERMLAISILMAIGGRAVERLVEVLVGEPDRSIRWNIALAIGLAAEAVAGPLTRALRVDTPVDLLARALEVAEPLLSPTLLAHFADLAEKGGPEVRQEVLRASERWPLATTYPILRRLIMSPEEGNRSAGIEMATRLKLDQVGADVGRILKETQNERLIRVCARYFAAVPNSVVSPVLSRIAERRPRFFGLVKGYSEETIAEVVRALALQAEKSNNTER